MTDTGSPATPGNPVPTTRSLLWAGALFGVTFYVIDVLVDVYLFQQGNLVEQLAHPGYHEIYMRGSIFFLFIAFAAYAGILLGRIQNVARRAQLHYRQHPRHDLHQGRQGTSLRARQCSR